MPSSRLLLAWMLLSAGAHADDQHDPQLLRLNHKPSFFTGLNVLNTAEPCGGLNGVCVPPGSHFKRLPWGTIPQFCFENATQALLGDQRYCSPYDVEVYEVTYNDCADHPVVMCRCHNASVSIHQMLHDFGKVPVKARQYIRSLKAV
ncbi:hypothetical protein QBC44DRAFT_373682 [Cladorrhinum sp. PSN332]|nr:hypothetical protein QBC44DRAFT_373682 [Cladorrhinum sp. PSN332]